MEGIDLLHVEHWRPFSYVGLTHPFFDINQFVVISTWAVLLMVLFFVLAIPAILKRKGSIARFMVLSFVEGLATFVKQNLTLFSFGHLSFIAALFIFILLCNCLSVIPWLEEPTQDLNTTLSLGIISFTYVQYHAIREHGFWHYLKEYLQPFFIMFPLHLVGKLATIVSLSFRLFGNIYGGATISSLYFSLIKSSVWYEIAGLVLGGNLVIALFFGLFEGLLQAFVFAMLTLTYLSIALHSEGEEGASANV